MSLHYFLKYAAYDSLMVKMAILLLLYVVSISLSRRSLFPPESHHSVLSTFQSIFLSHQIYTSVVTKSGNSALLDLIPLYVLPSSSIPNNSHISLWTRSSAPVSCFTVSSRNILVPLSLIPIYRAETSPPWVHSRFSHHSRWPVRSQYTSAFVAQL